MTEIKLISDDIIEVALSEGHITVKEANSMRKVYLSESKIKHISDKPFEKYVSVL